MASSVIVLSERAAACKKNTVTKPQQKQYVQTFCNFIEKVERNGINLNIYRCPNGDKLCKMTGARIEQQNGSGFSNPLKHILSCVYKGDEEAMEASYWEKKAAREVQGRLETWFGKKSNGGGDDNNSGKEEDEDNTVQPLVKKDIELKDWIDLIVKKNVPVSCVEDPFWREKLKHEYKFSRATVMGTMLEMCADVEMILAYEMKKAGRGSIIHDGWSKFGEHYFGLFASYEAERWEVDKGCGSVKIVKGPIISLLSLSPLHVFSDKYEGVDDDAPPQKERESRDVEVAANFTSEVHRDQIVDVMKQFYHIDIEEWLTCQTADNVSSNKKLARLLGVPHVSCESHLLNNEVKKFVKDTADDDDGAGFVVGKIHETMVSVKGSNKNMACLAKETNARPEHHGTTRFTGLSSMLKKWDKIGNHITAAADDDDADIVLPPTTRKFKTALDTTKGCFKDIQAVAIALQGRNMMLSKCRDIQTRLVDTVEEGMDNPDSHWYLTSFGNIYIPSDSEKRPDQHFLNAVCKYQKREKDKLTNPEKMAVKRWVVKNKAGPTKVFATLAEEMASENKAKKEATKKRKNGSISTENDDEGDGIFDHVKGTACEVERLWSVARYVLTTQRAKLSPLFFETIMFLKFNTQLWDEKIVRDAHCRLVKDNKAKRAEKTKAAIAEQEELDEAAEEEVLGGV